MAKQVKTVSAAGKLQGQKVALVGKFGYGDTDRYKYSRQVEDLGGEVVDPATTAPDCLVVGEGRGGKPPADVAKIQKKVPAVQVLDVAAFTQLLLPDRADILRQIGKGRQEDGDRYWENVNQFCWRASIKIDVRKADLRNTDLYGAHLQQIDFSGSDFRGAKLEYTEMGDLADANFEGCFAKNVYLSNLKNCKFRNADLEKAWLFHGNGQNVEQCDFTSAKMSGARMEHGTLTDCVFAKADLSDAEIEESTFVRADFTKADLSRVHANEAKLDGATFANANLSRADLRSASLQRADLRNANLREAVLSDADLTDANIAGADFQDAVLTGTKFGNVDLSKAKNLTLATSRVAGPKVLELAAAVAGSKDFKTLALVDFGPDEFAELVLSAWDTGCNARSDYHREGDNVFDWIPAPTFEQGMLNLADRWPKAKLRLDSITAKGCKSLRGKKLLDLAMAAWSEAFGVALQSPEQLNLERVAQQAEALRERDELMEKVRKKGAKEWNSVDYKIRDRIDMRGVDLSGANLNELSMWNRDLKGANFSGSSLEKAEMWCAQCQDANFTGANLQNCELKHSDLKGAMFRDANLTDADLTGTKLPAADFTGAILTNAKLSKAQYDGTTIFPAGFTPPAEMIWKGDGLRPGEKKKKVTAAKAGSLDFETFLKRLNTKVEDVRMQKAGSMLKAEKFQLFAEVQETGLAGIVKSQSSKELVYSCRLTSNGAFGCCTQNLRPCGGLRGALCKHLLVLIVGLAKAGELDPATVNHWVDLSRSQKPAIDEESMSATFLRYKGAEAGEVDWRPTETIPEDFYSM